VFVGLFFLFLEEAAFVMLVFVEKKILVKWKFLLHLAAIDIKAKYHTTIYMIASTDVGYCSNFLPETSLRLGMLLPRLWQVHFNIYGENGSFPVN